jgi:nicotinate-nucleotide adenylyltransferase
VRLGILGGTFDPPHLGHLAVAQDAWSRIGLDRVLFVPAAQPPHKPKSVDAPPALRLAMVRAAILGDDRFEATDLELMRQGPSYTADTLRDLAGRLPDAELFLLLGADQFREFATWREPAVIAALATLVVVRRAGIDAETGTLDATVLELDAVRIDVSSTEIRRRVAAGEPIRYLVPEGVRRIIEREGLYSSPDGVE